MVERRTIYEVAQRSGVSTATVSRVMQNGRGFSIETRDRVLAAAAELGWVPSGSARGLARRRAGIIGVLFHDFGDGSSAEDESPLWADQVIRGAERAATAAHDALLIAATNGTDGRELAHSVAGKVDGLVVVARSLPAADLAGIARTLPVVMLSQRDGRSVGADSVTADNRGGMAALVDHLLIHHGYRELAFVGGPARSPDAMERFAGYRDALRHAGITPPRQPHAVGEFTEAGGARAARTLLQRAEQPRAIVCGNDEMAIGVLRTLAAARRRVPTDIAVTGFDDLAITRHISPRLTTVTQPMRELGAAAVRTLLARIAAPEAPRSATVLPTPLMIRRSCGCRATNSPDYVRSAGRQ